MDIPFDQSGDRKQVGERIRQTRAELHLSQATAAQSMGVTSASLCQYEKGKRCPSDEQIDAFCEKYHVDREWLLYGHGEKEDGRPVFVREVEGNSAGERLKQLRMEKNLTQSAFGRAMKVTGAYISYVERGSIPMTEKFATRVEEIHGVGKEWLLYGDESMKDYPCNSTLIHFLRRHEDVRELIWKAVQREAEAKGQEEKSELARNDVRILRTRLGWTQRMLAEKLNIAQATVSKIEAGDISVSEKLQERILSVMKATEEEQCFPDGE